MNQLLKEFWKSVHICLSYYQISRGKLFLRHSVEKLLCPTGSWLMPPPGFQIYFQPCVSETFNLLTPKVDRFMPLLSWPLVPICIEIGSFAFKISCSQFGNGCYEQTFSHGTGTLRCLQKEMVTYRHWSVSLWRDLDNVPHCQILFPDKTEWRLISATLCGCCFVADQLWFMTRTREEEQTEGRAVAQRPRI